ncbi:ATP-NAD kinase family protein [Phreatobacter sp. AB_2022a]|uniref:ATP-NAD kinase family protein n=1 Tax=Phreatobacter sp. AB_2022a TaxID=3003134 RepID=UPI002286F3EE|nr:NAD(+)/NADH kinase [Phreatobacter sp. AB_2022a]MCZ0734886.1 NAD(+)/NADH kinase [Phreatobacter sp. AB_2022a]
MTGPVVGIIANPVSARDIRRIVAHAGSMQATDRANIVLRILAGLAAAGIGQVVMMPEHAGIRAHVQRAIVRADNLGEARFPALAVLDMPVSGTARDSATAARMMREQGVAAIVVLGGDGTHRVVVGGCGAIPIAGVSTGTNNAFPESREPTVTGLAVGLAATGAVPARQAFMANKRLDVTVNGRTEIALVDVAVVAEQFVGSRAIWKAEGFRELFVTFGEPHGIGMSAIAGLLAPVGRGEPHGRHIVFDRPETAPFRLAAPIAPGLVAPIGIERVAQLALDEPTRLTVPAGAIALDGEREIVFGGGDEVAVTLRGAAFLTVDIEACMAHAAASGRFLDMAGKRSFPNMQLGGC